MTIIINQTVEIISQSHLVSIGGLENFSVRLAEWSDGVVVSQFISEVFRAEMVNIRINSVPKFYTHVINLSAKVF